MSTGTIVAPWRFFFPAAACFALVAVPLWLLARGGALAPPVFPRGATWHASEMVFGYALAVIAGYLLPASSTARLAWLAAAWLAARALWPLAPHLPVGVAPLLACTFPVAVGWVGTRRFRGAKRPRNRIFAAVFVGLAALALATYLAAALGHAAAAATVGARARRAHRTRLGGDDVVALRRALEPRLRSLPLDLRPLRAPASSITAITGAQRRDKAATSLQHSLPTTLPVPPRRHEGERT